jgi:malonyl-CoA decarboxylase
MGMDKGSSFWNRALRNARSAWDKIATDNDGGVPSISSTPGLNDQDRVEVIKHMQACLDRRGGEVSARKRAAALGYVYLSLNKTGRKRFLTLLTEEFGTDHDKVDHAVDVLSQSRDEEDRFAAEQNLRAALIAPRVQLLTQFNALPEGVKFLVDMREELIPWAKKNKQLRGLESDLKTLLTNWFDVGFLELRQITWEAPASLLEKLFIYEAVHEIKGWDDLKNRLASDRRCFAFFHPRMPDEPLIFVWVALVNGISDNVQVLLDHNAPQGDPTEADCAIFYSISNAQVGLSAINFGNFLIKRVVDQLSRELPNINTFATLSPIPGFRRWLDRVVTEGSLSILSAENCSAVMALCPGKSAEAAVNEVLSRHDWHKDDELAAALKDPLQKLAAHYLINEKRASGTAENPVAHFHLNNGAIIAQIDWLADTSERGIKESAGIMINYLYKLKTIDNNHESYRAGEEVIASTRVRSLLKI